MLLRNVRQMMEKVGIPGTDQYERIASNKTFPDGAHFRVEVSGVESANILRATIDEGKKLGVPLHHVIAMVRGATLCDYFCDSFDFYYLYPQYLPLASKGFGHEVVIRNHLPRRWILFRD